MIKRLTRRTSATLPDTAKGASGAKGMELAEHIGRQLKAMFEDIAAEPVPEKFRELLDELERKSGKP
jgi:hypothetical protein